MTITRAQLLAKIVAATTGSSQTATAASNFAAGDTGVFSANIFPSGLTSVTIGGTAAVKKLAQATGGGAVCVVEMWVAANMAGGTNVVSFTGPSGGAIAAGCASYHGSVATPTWDTGAVASAAGTGASVSVSVTSPTWGSSGDALIAISGTDTGSNPGVITDQGSPWSSVALETNGIANNTVSVVDQIVSSNAAVTPTWIWDIRNGGAGWAALVGGLIESGGGGAVVIPDEPPLPRPRKRYVFMPQETGPLAALVLPTLQRVTVPDLLVPPRRKPARIPEEIFVRASTQAQAARPIDDLPLPRPRPRRPAPAEDLTPAAFTLGSGASGDGGAVVRVPPVFGPDDEQPLGPLAFRGTVTEADLPELPRRVRPQPAIEQPLVALPIGAQPIEVEVARPKRKTVTQPVVDAPLAAPAAPPLMTWLDEQPLPRRSPARPEPLQETEAPRALLLGQLPLDQDVQRSNARRARPPLAEEPLLAFVLGQLPLEVPLPRIPARVARPPLLEPPLAAPSAVVLGAYPFDEIPARPRARLAPMPFAELPLAALVVQAPLTWVDASEPLERPARRRVAPLDADPLPALAPVLGTLPLDPPVLVVVRRTVRGLVEDAVPTGLIRPWADSAELGVPRRRSVAPMPLVEVPLGGLPLPIFIDSSEPLLRRRRVVRQPEIERPLAALVPVTLLPWLADVPMPFVLPRRVVPLWIDPIVPPAMAFLVIVPAAEWRRALLRYHPRKAKLMGIEGLFAAFELQRGKRADFDVDARPWLTGTALLSAFALAQTAGDPVVYDPPSIYSGRDVKLWATVPADATPGTYRVPVDIADDQGRTVRQYFQMRVL